MQLVIKNISQTINNRMNALYDHGRQAFLDGVIDYLTDNVKAALVSDAYTPNLSTDQYLSDLGATILGTGVALTTKTSTAGIADADNVTFTSVTAGTVGCVVLYKDTGVSTTSPLIAAIETATGLPVTVPGGSNIAVNWDAVNAIFML